MAILNAFLRSLIAGLATGLGGCLVAVFGKLNTRTYAGLLGFAAGVMTAVATLGLVHEAVNRGNILITIMGIAIGAGTLFLLDRFLPICT